MSATDDRDQNLETAERLAAGAAAEGADLIVLPEMFNVFGSADVLAAGAEPLDGPTMQWASSFASKHGAWLVAGSFTEQIEGTEKHHNTSCLFDPDGDRVAEYRKVHLFDNEVPGAAYRESETVVPGDAIVVTEAAGHKLGMVVCYDIRFPEIFRAETLAGAELVSMPMAFMERTGRDHLDPLMRARAIENEIFVIVADQLGHAGQNIEFFGHSAIIDPWGTVLARAPERESFVVADLDFAMQAELRGQLPVIKNRRPDVYGELD